MNLQFLFECVLKVLADTGSCASVRAFFGDKWNSFDIVVLVALLVLTPMTGDGSGVGALRVLRILRLVRAMRVLRAARIFPQLQLILETLIRSTATVLYIMAFLGLISYVFAIVGGKLDCEPTNSLISEHDLSDHSTRALMIDAWSQ